MDKAARTASCYETLRKSIKKLVKKLNEEEGE